jgi:hypothetical protein
MPEHAVGIERDLMCGRGSGEGGDQFAEIGAQIGHEEIVLRVRCPKEAERGCFAPARERGHIEVGVFHGGVEPARGTTP